MKLLITGFPPFPGCSDNPSQQIVDAVCDGRVQVPGGEIRGELLPVEYRGVETAYLKRIGDFQPDGVLAFGVGRQESLLRLETRGINWDDAVTADNAGEIRTGTKIIPDGPDELHSGLNLVPLAELIRQRGIDVDISRDAGTYICNHLLYFAWHSMSRMDGPRFFTFSHVCPIDAGFALDPVLRALETMASWSQAIHQEAASDGNSPSQGSSFRMDLTERDRFEIEDE